LTASAAHEGVTSAGQGQALATRKAERKDGDRQQGEAAGQEGD
jgi:hypothetical protein